MNEDTTTAHFRTVILLENFFIYSGYLCVSVNVFGTSRLFHRI